MANYIDVDGKKYVQLDDGAIVPATAVLGVDGGFPVRLSDDQLSQIRTITFPSNYPLPASQVTDLKQVEITNFPNSFAISGFPASFAISNFPSHYPLPEIQFAKLQSISDTVNAWSTGSGTINGSTLRVTIATNQPPITVNPKRCTTGIITSVPASISAVTLADASANRLFCSIYNDSSAVLYLGLGFAPTTANYSVKILQDGYFEVPDVAAGLSIQGVWSATTGSGKVTRGS